ncbi:MAG TPA: NUDIX hydrolase [Clostridia bacterium]|jgi:8-oxo-dGTP diphosphatase|nr:NUDIX hydrolase [Clostridia bacterium]
MRKYPSDPIIGVGGIVLKDGSLLLVKRGNPPNKGCWGVPGGCLELGETLEEGVAREVLEECGIKVKVGELFDFFEVFERDDQGRLKFHYVLLDFLAEHVSGTLKNGGDAEECRYIPLADIWNYKLTPGVVELLKRMEKRGML